MPKQVYPVNELDPRAVYPLLTATVIPRPIAWVSSRSADGVDNLAPHSFFTVAAARPPIVQFTSVGEKDSVRNIRDTGEFVVAVVSEELGERANICGTDYPPEMSEYAEAGLTPAPSRLVGPPSVYESPVNLECTLHRIIEVGNCFVVMGEVVVWTIDDAVLDPDAKPGRITPSAELIRPLARLGGDRWTRLGETFELKRRPWTSPR